MAIAREVRYAHGIGWAHRCLARIYAKTGSWTQSMEHYQQAASTFEGIGSTFELGRTLQEMKTAQTVSGTETS